MPNARQDTSDKEESRGRFDLMVTFAEDARAREALMALRSAGFTPEQAILLEPESTPASSDPFAVDGSARVSPEGLAADRKLAIVVIITTEVAVGAIAGAVVGWIVSLFVHAPEIGPVWIWMLPLGALGAALGAGVGVWEWKCWWREVKVLRHETAIGLRFTGGRPASELQRARAILEQYGGSGMDNA
ncbi:MAG TPA: hypothetical protein VH540_16070 [Ktedonobacterales bacterium]|jgi:hypothetical protein